MSMSRRENGHLLKCYLSCYSDRSSLKRKPVSRTGASQISTFELEPAQKWTRDFKASASDYKQKRVLSDETKWMPKEGHEELSELTRPWRPKGQEWLTWEQMPYADISNFTENSLIKKFIMINLKFN